MEGYVKLRVSVIIPTYDRADLLKQTLLCLEHQEIDLKKYQVIICDDGSKDNTKDVTCSFENNLDIRYCYQPDKGFRAATARNMGIRLAHYEICVFLDAGVLVGSNLIQNIIDFHKQYKRGVCLGIVHGCEQPKNHPAVRLLQPIANSENPELCLKSPMLMGYPDPRQSTYLKAKYDLNKLRFPWALFWTGLVSVETDILHNVGLFDESFVGWGHEDIELGYRLWKSGINFRADPNVRALHLPHKQFSPTHVEEKNNRLRVYQKHQDYSIELWSHLQCY